MWEQVLMYVQMWFGSFTFELGRYVVGAGGVFLLINLLLKKPLAGRKIRKKHARPRQMFREIRASMMSVSVYALVGLVTYLAIRAGILDTRSDPSEFGWLYFGFSVVAMIERRMRIFIGRTVFYIYQK